MYCFKSLNLTFLKLEWSHTLTYVTLFALIKKKVILRILDISLVVFYMLVVSSHDSVENLYPEKKKVQACKLGKNIFLNKPSNPIKLEMYPIVSKS